MALSRVKARGSAIFVILSDYILRMSIQLYRSGYGQCAHTRIYNESARGCVAGVGCGRYGNLTAGGRKLSCCGVIGVVGAFNPCNTVEGDGNILENRNESIGKDNVVGSSGFRVA